MTDPAISPADFAEIINALRRSGRHDECEDCWYSCAIYTCDDERRSDTCDCGAQQSRDVLARIAPEVLAEVVAMDPERND